MQLQETDEFMKNTTLQNLTKNLIPFSDQLLLYNIT